MGVKIRIANSEIELGKKYVLDHRFDASAPSYLKTIGATKYPFEDNHDIERVVFNEDFNMYDTGFDKSSPCLRIIKDEAEREELVKQYVKYIQKPYETLYNTKLSPNEDNTFWLKYEMRAFVNKQFDTNKPQELMELFHLLNLGVICEKDEKSTMLKANARFTLISNESLKSKSKDKVKVKLETTNLFMTLLKGDRDKLNLILQWVDREDSSLVGDEDLSLTYYQVINGEDGVQFSEKFKKSYEEYDTPQGQEKMEWFYAISKLYQKRKIQKTKRGYMYGELFLGNTLQNVAEFCLNEKNSQHEIIKQLIEENPNVRRETPEHLKPKTAK